MPSNVLLICNDCNSNGILVGYSDFHRNNPLFLIPVSLIMGILVGNATVIPMWAYVASFCLAVLMALSAHRYPIAASVGVYVATLVIGAWLMGLRKQQAVCLPVAEHTYEAVVESQPQIRGKVYRCDLRIMAPARPLKVRATMLRHSQVGGDTLRVGDGVVITAVLASPDSILRTDDRFDYSRWLRVHGYDATVFVWKRWTRRQLSVRSLPASAKLRLAASVWRSRLVERYARMGLEDRQLALLSAMTLGDRSLIDKEQQKQYSVSGGSHILALSGLHLTIIFAILMLVFGSVEKVVATLTAGGFRRVMHTVSLVVALTAIWCYVVLVGMSPSVVRAATMLSIYGLVSMLNRRRMSVNALAFAAIVMLIANPLTLWDVGFQMSFMAVLGIFVFRTGRKMGIVPSMLWISVAAQMGVAPLIMYYFGRFACYFLLTNCVVIPCATLLLYGAVAVWVLSPFAVLQQWMVKIVVAAAGWMDAGVGWIASLPGASVENIRLTVIQVVAIYILIFCTYRIICLTLHTK